jgi:hypothetical protein
MGQRMRRASWRPIAAALLASLLATAAWAQDDAQRVVAETGGPADRYVDANFADPSAGGCTVLLSVVRAGDLAKVTGGFQLALDLKIDLDHPADYAIGMGENGRSTFAGGALTEMTGAFKDGVLRIPNAPKYFDIEAEFGPGSGASAMIHRVCFGPETTLIYVVDNPDTGAKGGDWLWVKPGG